MRELLTELNKKTMKTKYLDNEIELLNSIKRNNELSSYGKEKLNEFNEIKKQLTLTDVVEMLKGIKKITFEEYIEASDITKIDEDTYGYEFRLLSKKEVLQMYIEFAPNL